jgi:hypothetical protein
VSDKTLQRLSEVLEVDIYELLFPFAAETAAMKHDFHPQLVDRLKKTMKADIDRRLNDFFGKMDVFLSPRM